MEILINLLPSEKKEELKNLRLVGVIFKVGLSGLFSLVVLWAFLFFCRQVIETQKKQLEVDKATFATTSSYLDAEKSQKEIKMRSEQAKKIRVGLLDKQSYWEVVNEINTIMPDEIFLKSFTVIDGKVELTGISKYRQSLLVLEEKMKENDMFNDVESPISNIVANENVDFELSAKLKEYNGE